MLDIMEKQLTQPYIYIYIYIYATFGRHARHNGKTINSAIYIYIYIYIIYEGGMLDIMARHNGKTINSAIYIYIYIYIYEVQPSGGMLDIMEKQLTQPYIYIYIINI